MFSCCGEKGVSTLHIGNLSVNTTPDVIAKCYKRFVSTCMTYGSLTLLPLNVSCGTSGVLWTSVFSFMLPLSPPSLGILMLTGLVVYLHDALLSDIVFLGDNLLSWSSKRQHTISRSSAEAEYRGIANVVTETAWLCNLLRELHSPLSTATLVYCDNVGAVYLSANPVQHQRTKHIEIDIHFVRDMVQTGHIWVLHVPSRYQYADIFTKGLPTALFEDFRSSLSVWLPPAQTAGPY
nr:ribonuclease H-like domain-containing protein [Tanacetum cinerariifolium]